MENQILLLTQAIKQLTDTVNQLTQDKEKQDKFQQDLLAMLNNLNKNLEQSTLAQNRANSLKR